MDVPKSTKIVRKVRQGSMKETHNSGSYRAFDAGQELCALLNGNVPSFSIRFNSQKFSPDPSSSVRVLVPIFGVDVGCVGALEEGGMGQVAP